MKYFVFTSKHHDGFAMYRSKADKFNVVDATPFGRDVVGELAEACYKYGLKLGLYYSRELDRHHEHGGGYDLRAFPGTTAGTIPTGLKRTSLSALRKRFCRGLTSFLQITESSALCGSTYLIR